MHVARIRRVLAVVFVLSIVIPTSAGALTWGPVQPITTSGLAAAWAGSLTASGTTVHVAYREWVNDYARVFARSSVDGGASWDAPVQFGGDGGTAPAIASVGDAVSLAWSQFTSDGKLRVKYRSSADGGATWSAARTVVAMRAPDSAPLVSVARNAAGRVVVGWTNPHNGRVTVRVDSGSGFGPNVVLATTVNRPIPTLPEQREAFLDLAITNQKIYAAYAIDASTVVFQRSGNGASWSAPGVIAHNSSGYEPSVAAKGGRVLVGYAVYTGSDIWSVLRRSTDEGRTWGSRIALSPESGKPSFQPLLTYRDGAWRTAFTRCTRNDCSTSAVFYRESADGVAWGSVDRISPEDAPNPWPVGVEASGGQALVAYMTYDPGTEEIDIHLRRGG